MPAKKPDGGPAFPVPSTPVPEWNRDNQEYDWDMSDGIPGMSLRDWFAGMVIQGGITFYGTESDFIVCAKHAYESADAMLAEREKD